MIDNQPMLRGMLAASAVPTSSGKKLFVPGRVSYMEGCPPASYLPEERIRMLDAWGVDAGVLFPTVGILWDVADNGLADGLCARLQQLGQ